MKLSSASDLTPGTLNRMLQFHDSRNDQRVIDRDKIQIDLIKLPNGERLLRLTEPQSGLALEKKLVSEQSVTRQKEQLFGVFEAALARAELHAA